MKLSDLTKKRIRLAYSIVLSVLIVATGVLFAVSCYSISASGDHPFTVESISLAFDRIKIPVFLTVAVLVGSIALHLIMPAEESRRRPQKMSRTVLKKLSGRLDLGALSDEERVKIEKERGLRRALDVALAVLAVLSAILPLIYLLDPNNFPAEEGKYNSEILHGMIFYTLSLAPLFVYSVIRGILCERSVIRETALVKEAIKTSAPVDGTEAQVESSLVARIKEREGPIVLGLRIAIFGAAAVFIIVGVVSGGAASVLAKAVKICTECIGLG